MKEGGGKLASKGEACMRMGCNTSPNVPSEPASPERVGGSHLAQEHQAEAAVPA